MHNAPNATGSLDAPDPYAFPESTERLSAHHEHVAFLVDQAHCAWKLADQYRDDARRMAGYAADSWTDAYNAWQLGSPVDRVARHLSMACHWRESFRRSLRLATRETRRGDAWDRKADEAQERELVTKLEASIAIAAAAE